MGIPRFYRWLKQRYPMIRCDMTDPDRELPVFDSLYIDFNAMIYRCIRESGCFLKNKVYPLTFERIYQRVMDYLLQLVRLVNPRKMLFIAFDGVAPRAKINQSRDRRFRSGVEDIEFFENLIKEMDIKTKQNFQTNSISPGTDFLFNLCQHLRDKIYELMSGQWSNLLVFYSDCCVPGEGEHKLIEFLRFGKETKLFGEDATHCVYSPDADVILLTLALDLEYICIIKEDTTVQPGFSWCASSAYRSTGIPKFQLVFINILREYLSIQFAQELQLIKGCTIQDIINDFVLLMAFIGNDFLPVEFCFRLSDSHMEGLFQSYRVYLQENQQFINLNGNIQWNKICALLKVAKKFQAFRITEMKTKRRMSKQANIEEIFQEDQEIEKFEVQDDRIVNGKNQYYQSRFNIQDKQHSVKFVNIVKKYIEGLEFYCQYYYRGLPSWTWFYPFHYTPLLTDVYQYLRTKIQPVKLNKGSPFDPFLALMFMFPTQNFGLLPKPIVAALQDPKCILRSPVDYFPRNFILDKHQTLSYNKKAMIQFLKEEEVRQVYESIPRDKFTKAEQNRNSKRKTILFYDVGGHFSGMEVLFAQSFEKELKKIFHLKFNKNQESTQRRFPTLKIYGDKLQFNDKKKLVTQHKYKFSGNPTQLIYFNGFIGYVKEGQKVSKTLLGQISVEYLRKLGIAGNCQEYYVVKRGKYVREMNRDHVTMTRKEVIVPDFALFKAPNYDFIHRTQVVQVKNRYCLKQRVVVLSAKYFGCTGLIEELGEKTLKVRLNSDPIQSEERIEESEQDFFSITHVLSELQISRQTLFAIIGEVVLLPIMKKKQFNERVPTSLNFGLNFIDVPNARIVPRFVRCNFKYENTKTPQKMFDNLQLSETALKLLQQYMKTFGWLVQLLEESRSPRIKKEFKASGIFRDEKNPNLRLFKEFIKLYEFDNKGTFCSFYSKTADLTKLPKMYTEKKSRNSTVTLEYWQVTSQSLGRLSPPPMRSEPEYIDIGSRVILLKSLQVGFVVCIDDNWVYVVVGKEKRKMRAKFTEVFSEKWEFFLARDVGTCWNLDVGYFTPTYWKKAIK